MSDIRMKDFSMRNYYSKARSLASGMEENGLLHNLCQAELMIVLNIVSKAVMMKKAILDTYGEDVELDVIIREDRKNSALTEADCVHGNKSFKKWKQTQSQ
jgi:hypothetical protein